jgi:hypothetical protein
VKKQLTLVLFLLILACISGYLMSQPSLVGRVGMDLFYKQYQFLKTWWQGALLVFVVWIVLMLLQGFVQKKLSASRARIFHIGMIMLSLVGFYFTWSDFHNSTTHRWLKNRFHIGAYLFWVGWILVSLHFLLQKKDSIKIEKERGDIALPKDEPAA